jgi:N-acetylneuraminic acid mutarotase
VLRYHGSGRTKVVARLPAGLRYAGVAVLGRKIYVAGGLTPSGETAAVDAVDLRSGAVHRIATLPTPIAYAALVAFRGALYLVGGKSSTATPLATVLRIDPLSGRVTRAAALPQPLAEPAAVARAGDIVVIGGENSNLVYSLRP